MSKIDFSTALIGLDGEPLKTPDRLGDRGQIIKAGVIQTLGKVCVDALVTVERGASPDGKVSFTRYQLAQKINGQGEVEVDADEIVMLKDRVGKNFGPVVVGPVYIILEGGK